MADLGDFGRAVAQAHGRPADVDVFRFHGEPSELPANISDLVLMEFADNVKVTQAAEQAGIAWVARAEAAMTAEPSQANHDGLTAAEQALTTSRLDSMAGMFVYIHSCIGAEHFPRFRRVCVRDGVKAPELMELCAQIMSAVADRPTQWPSDSTDGPSTTGDSWTASSASPERTPGLPPYGSPAGTWTPDVRLTREPPLESTLPQAGAVFMVQDPPRPETPLERQHRELGQYNVPVGKLLTSIPSSG